MKSPTLKPRRAWLQAATTGLLGLALHSNADQGERAAADALTGHTLHVGPQRSIKTLAEAARRARDGDSIEMDAGDYVRDAAVWTQDRLTIRAAGGPVRLLASGAAAEGKAIWVVRGGDIAIDGIEFRGCRVPDGNGAGIRLERGRLRLQRCRFFDNEMGLISANTPDIELAVHDCDFGLAPRHPGPLHHLLYAGSIGRFSLTCSRFSGGWRGHLVKSRALVNRVLLNTLDDGDQGEASYELEFPEGGHNVVAGNVIVQSPGSQNSTLLSMGAEAQPGTEASLLLAHNTLVNRAPSGRFVHVRSERLRCAVTATNNLCSGGDDLSLPEGAQANGNRLVDLAEFRDADRGDYALRAGSALIGQAPAFAFEPGLSAVLSALPGAGGGLLAARPSPGAVQPGR